MLVCLASRASCGYAVNFLSTTLTIRGNKYVRRDPIQRSYRNIESTSNTLFRAAPTPLHNFNSLSASATAAGVLTQRTKKLMSISIATATRCEGCIVHHVESAVKLSASRKEIAEAVAVAVAMGGGSDVVYGATALAAYDELSIETAPLE